MMTTLTTTHGHRGGHYRQTLLAACLFTIISGSEILAQTGPACNRTITADVVALDQAFFLNRFGASMPQGMIFALLEDVESVDGGPIAAGNVQLRPGKRPRPIVLRMNVGDCLQINFLNLLNPTRIRVDQPATRAASVHVMGMQLVGSILDDGSNVGANPSGLVQPGSAGTYTFHAEREGPFVLHSFGTNTGGGGNGGQLTPGMFGAVNVEPAGAEWYRSQVTNADVVLATVGTTLQGHPLINYDAVYPAAHPLAGRPIFKMLDAANKIRHSDLTAIITGTGRQSFPAGTYRPNPIYPDRDQAFREFTLIYHDEPEASQAFDIYKDPVMGYTLNSVRDAFLINYGAGGIGSEILANRFGVGPVWDCTGCKYEEFFLSSWPLGDPAMVVDLPANSNVDANGVPIPGPQATVALYPDDPSNVYHSYIGDHVKQRVLHGGVQEHHIHHLHAHQWLHTPDSDNSAYLDSQAIGPGSAYTLEIPYRGTGNRNQVVGDSIFHCHFYPHFAQGMWALWRSHDVFETGTVLDANGRPVTGARALPDAEIVAGTPIPAVVPIPGLVMPPMPEADVDIVQIAGQPGGQVQVTGTGNPGYPFFIPAVAGHRPPHPPMDTIDDGGLPRHVLTGGTTFSIETRLDFTKEVLTANATQLPETGTPVELAAMDFHAQRLHQSFTTDGVPANFIVNGLPPAPGAPYADPCIDDAGNPVGSTRIYKAANLQIDAVLNKEGWHFPQQRLITLWEDVAPTMNATRPPEPFFFRANSDDCIEYHHTNLVPNYYELDDFQVRTPTDILGQHIHLVKFDVTSSDGSGNGWNYEDGTFAPDEVIERVNAIRAQNNCTNPDARDGTFDCPVAQPHPFFGAGPNNAWLGAQTTIQRWYADDVLNNLGEDRTLRTVFTHDHYGPSTHQQAGLYAGLVVEPKGSAWRDPETGVMLGTRTDGGPTSFRADILTANPADSYREFMLEFADYQLSYFAGNNGFPDPASAIMPPGLAPGATICPGGVPAPCPEAVSDIGTPIMSVNYRNEPTDERLINPATGNGAFGAAGDLAHIFRSITREDPNLNVQPTFYPPLTAGVQGTDPFTPLLRAYENDNTQIRILVGAQTDMHNFSIHGIKWLFEPSDPNSGFRNSQPMGISEHHELLFNVPPSDGPEPFVDYLYRPNSSTIALETTGLWGIMRAYDGDIAIRNDLLTLPSNPMGRAPLNNPQDFVGVCPVTAPLRQFNVTATTADQSLPGHTLVYNSRTSNGGPIDDPEAILLFRSSDLGGGLNILPGVPIEPLVLRANAGDCIEVTLFNEMSPNAAPFSGGQNASIEIGLHPQLVSYDMATDDAANVGSNPVQTVLPGGSRTYRWYAGNITVNPDGTRTGVPVEFGAVNLMPADQIQQVAKGMIGALIIEPQGATWVEDVDSRTSATVTKSDGSSFREFVLMFQDIVTLHSPNFLLKKFTAAINYRTEPMWQRMGYNPDTTTLFQTAAMDYANAVSNTQVGGDPETPIFRAKAGSPVRFRVLHPGGFRPHVFEIHGHVWEEEPYINNSTEIGDNPLSEWKGSRMGHGPTSHFDLVLKNGAGGKFGVTGDYLYRTFTANEFDEGIWGIFRVSDCLGDADCDDGLFCNGAESCLNGTCQPGAAVACDDGVTCTADSCNETVDACENVALDSLCDNGLFCDGVETCDPINDCQAGIAPLCDDGVACTVDSCNTNTDACDHAADDTACDDGMICTGVETCDPTAGCLRGTPPAACCSADNDCDNGDDCDGIETCSLPGGTCVFGAPVVCDDGVFCNGVEFCDLGLCQASAPPCSDVCQQCNETLTGCKWCIFDHNLNGVTDGLDFAFFTGCFGACYAPGDPCLAASYDQDAGNCVGGGDFGAFSACFSLGCGQCTNCWGPGTGGGAPSPQFPGIATPSQPDVVISLVAVQTPSLGDQADELPESNAAPSVDQPFYVEVWASRSYIRGDNFAGIASAYVNLRFDPQRISVDERIPTDLLAIFAGGVIDSTGAVRSLGGCAPLGDGSVGVDSPWVRVAILKAHAASTGATEIMVVPAADAYGISLFGRFGNLDASRIEFHGLELQIDREPSVGGQALRPLGRQTRR